VCRWLQDWDHVKRELSNGAEVVEYDGFFSFLFHICDTWTFTASVQEYVDFLDEIMRQVQRLVYIPYIYPPIATHSLLMGNTSSPHPLQQHWVEAFYYLHS